MIKSVAELTAIRDAMQPKVGLRQGLDLTEGKIRKHVLICGGTGCTSSGSQAIYDKLASVLEAKGIADEIKIVMTGCFGLCALGPVMIVYPDGTFYSRVEVSDVKEIVEEHLLKGRKVERLVYSDTGEDLSTEENITKDRVTITLSILFPRLPSSRSRTALLFVTAA